MSFELSGKVLVTGATGFLGGAFVRHLKNLGIAVVGQGRNAAATAQLRLEGIPTVEWSFEKPLTDLQRAELQDIDAVVHAAALSAPFGRRRDFAQANVQGTRVVLNLAEQVGVRRFVLISSPSVYFALQDQLDVNEHSSLPKPFNPYAWSKAEAEKLVLAASIGSRVILRPRGIYGPGETTLLPRLMRVARERALPVFRDGAARIDLTFIDDAVEAVAAALVTNKRITDRIYNVSGREVLGIQDIVERCCMKSGVEVRWRPMPLQPALIAAFLAEQLALLGGNAREPPFTRYGLALFAFEQSLNIDRIHEDLGWSPKVTFREGLERTFEGDLR